MNDLYFVQKLMDEEQKTDSLKRESEKAYMDLQLNLLEIIMKYSNEKGYTKERASQVKFVLSNLVGYHLFKISNYEKGTDLQSLIGDTFKQIVDSISEHRKANKNDGEYHG